MGWVQIIQNKRTRGLTGCAILGNI